MIIEYDDIKPFIPRIKKELREELAKEKEEKFLSYPRGMQEFLFNEVTPQTYQRVYLLWNKRGFPRTNKPGLKGVWLSDLKNWQS